jgi:small GTP-binding protein
MLQKKICMVGVFGTGKTSLVQHFVQGIFTAKYLSTVGVKIDRKEVKVGDQKLNLMLWDLEGRDHTHDINPSYVKGAHGLIYVIDGTRPETLEQTFEIREMVTREIGEIPSVAAVNKIDLVDQWTLQASEEQSLGTKGLQAIRTSAKSGVGVDATFQWLAGATLENR